MLLLSGRFFDIIHFTLVFVEFDFYVTLVRIDDLDHRLLLLLSSVVVHSTFHHLVVQLATAFPTLLGGFLR